MAYENGKRVNRYSAQEKHRDIQRKKHTPKDYSSFYNYCQDELRQDARWELWEQTHLSPESAERQKEKRQKFSDTGRKRYYTKYWKKCGEIALTYGEKKLMKEVSNSKDRHHYKNECRKAVEFVPEDEDDGFSVSPRDSVETAWKFGL